MFGEEANAERQSGCHESVEERRAAIRRPCFLEVTCRVPDAPPDECWRARVRDLSEQGIGLVLAYPLERGMVLTVEVSFPEEARPRPLGVCVIHSTPRDEGGFSIGCVFDARLRKEDVNALLQVNLLEV